VAQGLEQFYENHYAKLIEPLLAITMHGTSVDVNAMKRRFAKLTAECITIQDELTTLAGEPLYTKKSLSTQKVSKFLYETLKLRKQTTKGKVTVNEVALRRMAIQQQN